MTHGNEIPSAYRAHRSEFDHRAIDMTGHLLLGAVSLERRIAAVPKHLSALVQMAGRNGSTGRLQGPLVARATDHES
jgi:hypothetical protein